MARTCGNCGKSCEDHSDEYNSCKCILVLKDNSYMEKDKHTPSLEEKIKEILIQYKHEHIELNEAMDELKPVFTSEIREEKIKALEEIMASEQKVAVAIAIALLKLRSEGKEKGKV